MIENFFNRFIVADDDAESIDTVLEFIWNIDELS